MVMLYNRTMDSRYLDFAKYIVSEWGYFRRSAAGVESACGCAGGGTFPESRVGTGVVVVGKRSESLWDDVGATMDCWGFMRSPAMPIT